MIAKDFGFASSNFGPEIRIIGKFARYMKKISQTALPVELALFYLNVNGNIVSLNWTTSSESNNYGFDIERSEIKNQVLSDWRRIGFIKGNGTIALPVNYTFTDKLCSGKFHYRLKQIDYNGNFKYYNLQNEIVIGVPNISYIAQNYPNPFNPTTKIEFQIPEESDVVITLFDISGREIKNILKEIRPGGFYSINFNSSGLSSGVYFYRIRANGVNSVFNFTKKMLIIK